MKVLDYFIDSLFFVLVACVGYLFYMGTTAHPAQLAPVAVEDSICVDSVCVDTVAVIAMEQSTPRYTSSQQEFTTRDCHVTLSMLDTLSPYPLLAYCTVIAESGWSSGKSNLAKVINNNIGMMVMTSRFNACTIEDTALIRQQLNLVFNKDYGIATYNGKPIVNKQGKTMVCYGGKWAIFLSPEHCARDLAEYQRINILPKHAMSPKTYLRRLRELNYFTASDEKQGYIAHWLSIYKTVLAENNTSR